MTNSLEFNHKGHVMNNPESKWECVCCKQPYYGASAAFKRFKISLLGFCWFCIKAGCRDGCQLETLLRKYKEFDKEDQAMAALLGVSTHERHDV